MTPRSSLLTSLRKFRPRETKDSLENFITAAFAWLLRNHSGFERFFLSKITERLAVPAVAEGVQFEWQTQLNLEGTFPDLVGEADSRAFVFEHKAWTSPHANQLPNYRERAERKYGEGGFHLILITGATHLWAPGADLNLCWRDVHQWIKEWQEHRSYEPDFLFGDFQLLLETEGMGPPAPISHESIFAFKAAQGFEWQLIQLIERLRHHPWLDLLPAWRADLFFPKGCQEWGRTGFNLLGNSETWAPGLGAWFLLYPADHRVDWQNPQTPDFSIIVDVNANLFPNYSQLPSYQKMRDDLQRAVEIEASDFEFLDHLGTHPSPNRWHPIHIRMPMVELFRGTVDADDQDRRFIRAASQVLGLVGNCAAFWEFRDDLARIKSASELPPSRDATQIPAAGLSPLSTCPPA
jgi:hypothetical protein